MFSYIIFRTCLHNLKIPTKLFKLKWKLFQNLSRVIFMQQYISFPEEKYIVYLIVAGIRGSL